jgi:hypothetical protein
VVAFPVLRDFQADRDDGKKWKDPLIHSSKNEIYSGDILLSVTKNIFLLN